MAKFYVQVTKFKVNSKIYCANKCILLYTLFQICLNGQRQSLVVTSTILKTCFEKFYKIHKQTYVREIFFSKIAGLRLQLYYKWSPRQEFSYFGKNSSIIDVGQIKYNTVFFSTKSVFHRQLTF